MVVSNNVSLPKTNKQTNTRTHARSVIDSYNRLQDDAVTTQRDRNLSVQTLVNAYYGACMFRPFVG